MAKVKLTCGRVGTGMVQTPGQVVDVSEAEAKRLVASQQAVPTEQKQPRTATRKAQESR